jgi:hypothetical protein
MFPTFPSIQQLRNEGELLADNRHSAHSAHNRSHVNAPTLCRFAQSYIIGVNYVGESAGRRTAALADDSDLIAINIGPCHTKDICPPLAGE